ncbi:MAG TPA: Rieske 2Fe-2S domain-containing protein [Sporichthyaceae bacterium]|jgi:ubiquinol-cytochrome c reductase iron-sulfur subunit|nr:Rieske 2Fe-2S domain-containing protein [Sporichthyaceae bacterium]
MSDSHDPHGHGSGHGSELAHPTDDPFANPGLPHHELRRTDVDERAAKRAERQVAAMFTVSSIATVAFVVCFVAIDPHSIFRVIGLGDVSSMNFALGLSLTVSLLGIGFGQIHWARKLMNSAEMVQDRHPMKSSAADTADVLEMVKAGGADSALPRRKLIWMSLAGAMAAFPITMIMPLRDLGPLPKKVLRHTLWAEPKRRQLLQANSLKPIRPEDMQAGSLMSVHPTGEVTPEDLAKAAVMIIRLRPEEVRGKNEAAKGYEGIMAFSKICVHAGCPLGLYEHSTHHMLCPCHQSTFDLANGGRVIFGPAARNLPQLAITVDQDGYLVAERDFDEPVGPSYWERG